MFVFPSPSARATAAALLATLAFGCGADPEADAAVAPAAGGTSSAGAASSGASSAAGAATNAAAAASGGGASNAVDPSRCRAPAGTTGSPHTIEEAVALLNALPKPTSAACFVQSLDRPLIAFATSSTFSAQPAMSPQSPRVFIKIDRLWISVVMDGDSSYLIELSYLLPEDFRSIKGEVKTPLLEALPPGAPYERVRYGAGTVCGLCHTLEEPVADITFAKAFASTAFRPRPDTRVALDALLSERQRCNATIEPHRCEMLAAVFDGGTVTEESFPGAMPTFY